MKKKEKAAEAALPNPEDELKNVPVEERKTTLAKIIRGELLVKKTMIDKGEIEHIDVTPGFSERLNAMKELNKMEGCYMKDGTAFTREFTCNLNLGFDEKNKEEDEFDEGEDWEEK